MRSLILHTNEFRTRLNRKSNRPNGIIPDKKKADEEKFGNGLVVFFCVEKGDNQEHVNKLYDEICKTSDEVMSKNVLISPFVHLSKNIAKPKIAKEIYNKLMEKMNKSSFITSSSHFGYHKSVKLDIKGHPGSVRYREFY